MADQPAKRRKLSSTTLPAHQSVKGEEEFQKLSSRKLCAVWRYPNEKIWPLSTEVLIGILDLNSGGGFTTQIRIPGDSFRCEGMSFWALGSTMYAFEAWDRHHLENPMDGKSVFSIDLSSLIGDVTLYRKMVKQCHPLQFPKFLSGAIGAPGGRILVFTLVFHGHASNGGFEIYDPKGGESEVLPNLLPSYGNGMGINAYSFVRESEFLIQLDKKILLLDLNSREKGWQVLGTYGGVERIPFTSPGAFYVVDDRFCFTSDSVSDKAHVYGLNELHMYPLRSFLRRQRGFSKIAPIGDDGYDRVKEEFNFCVFSMNIEDESEDYGAIVIRVCCTDLKQYKRLREGKEAADESDDPIITNVIKTLEFMVDDDKYPSSPYRVDLMPYYVFVF